MDIIALLPILSQCLDETTLRRLGIIVIALLSMTGRVTMLGLSRWAEKGGSYRTVQRFYNTVIPWGVVLWLFFAAYLYRAEGEYLLVGDESVVSKAGHKSYGVDRFFSSIFGKPILGLAFFALSLVSIEERKSYPLLVEQVKRSEAEKVASQAKKAKKAAKPAQSTKSSKKKGKPGRPKGVKNQDKRQIEWTEELLRLKRMASELLERVKQHMTIRYLVLDGHFGNNNVTQMVRQSLSLHLICKLRQDSALYFPYAGAQARTGAQRIYGHKLAFATIPTQYLVKTFSENGIQTDIYQATMLHKSFADQLNIVIILKTNLATQRQAHVILFSSDLTIAYDKLIDAYQLRFQIEFNFRDAKQFWGFEDFMNVNQLPLTNAVGLAFFMLNLSHLLVSRFRQTCPQFGILDLKAHFRTRRYLREALKLLPDFPDTILFEQALDSMPALGSIHAQSTTTLSL
jgi:putative transposase